MQNLLRLSYEKILLFKEVIYRDDYHSIHTKTDKVDSEVLAYFAAANRPELWQPPSPEALLLKALLSRHDALTADLLREKNRLEKAEATHTPPQILASIHASIIFISAQIACFAERAGRSY
ncbi:MAG: transposase [Agitococcus sp.]|nr:transposase [Agitococcus sp.]